MVKLLTALWLLLGSGCMTLQAQTAIEKIREGIALHENAQYEDAIKLYDEVIAADPKNTLAFYEKTYSLLLLKKYKETIDLCKYIISRFPKDENLPNTYINWGTALDYQGKGKEAIKVYEKGLKAVPGHYLLNFNKAITLHSRGEREEAIKSLQQGLRNNPLHPSSHHVLGILTAGTNKIAGLLSNLAYLAIQPQATERANYNREQVEKIIGKAASKKDGNNITINVALPSKKKKENDFSTLELIVGLTSAAGHTSEHENETDIERMQRNLGVVFSGLSEGRKEGKGFYWDFYAPFFARLEEEGHRETFVHVMYTSSGAVLNELWLQDNRTKVDAFKKWLSAYKWNAE